MSPHPELFETLPDFRFKGAGHRRAHMGSLMEEIVCALLWLTRLGKHGNASFRPDAENGDKLPVEIKSVCVTSKCRGKAVLYDWRLAKEAANAERLAYMFAGHHSAGLGKAKDAKEFLDRIADRGLELALVPAWQVRADAFACPHHAIKTHRTTSGKRNGYQRKGYKDGYRNLEVSPYFTGTPAVEVSAVLWGRTFSGNVFPHPAGAWSAGPLNLPPTPTDNDHE